MFSGNGYGMSSMGFGSIFNSIGCTSTTYGSTKNGTGSMIGALVAGLALNYAPRILGGFIGGISSAVQTSRAQKAEENKYSQQAYDSENIINQVLSNVGLENSEALKRDLISKHENMLVIAKQNGETLDLEEVQTRLTNYAKGWKFNQFNVNANLGLETPEYESECSKATTKEELKEAYNQFAKEYIEFYDQDSNDSISIEEMFYQELIQHYTTQKRMSTAEAKEKAIQVVTDYSEKGYGINAEHEVNYPKDDSDETGIFALILNKILRTENTLQYNFDHEFNTNEIASYLFAMASIKDEGNNITTGDAIQMNWASVDTETQIYENMLEEAKNYLDS